MFSTFLLKSLTSLFNSSSRLWELAVASAILLVNWSCYFHLIMSFDGFRRRNGRYRKKRKYYIDENGFRIPRYNEQPIDNEQQYYQFGGKPAIIKRNNLSITTEDPIEREDRERDEFMDHHQHYH